MQIEKIIDHDVEEKILNSFEGMYKDRNKNIFLLLVNTGMKVSELCNLDIHDVVDDSWSVKPNIFVSTDKKKREIPLTAAARKILRYFLPKDEEGPLIISNKYEAITPRQIQRIFKDVSKKVGTIVMPSYCRYTYIARRKSGGKNVK